ncbi:hypothetical protein BDZ89DRAFT_1135926 [Hymenopellis radicata]|nr:hypothetical protein BDZ89DRAFT_1135926 [Hymenopellis radicata]
MADPSLAVVVRQILGPLLIGAVVYALLLGVCSVQYFTYFTSGFNDSKVMFVTVIWMAIVDVLLTMYSVAVLWHYLIEHFADTSVLQSGCWNLNLLPLLSTLTAIPVQIFLANRIRRFSTSRILFGVLVTLSIGAAVPAWISSVNLVRKSNLAERGESVKMVFAWFAIGAACDVSLSALMIFYLWRQKTAFKHTNRIIYRYIQISIQSAVPVTLCAIVAVILGTTSLQTNLHEPFTLNLGRFYTITLLTTLNTRIGIRETENVCSVNSVDLKVIGRRARQLYGQDLSIGIAHTQETDTDVDVEWPANVKGDPTINEDSVRSA